MIEWLIPIRRPHPLLLFPDENAKKIPFSSSHLTPAVVDKSGRGHYSGVLLPRAFGRPRPQNGAVPRPFGSNTAQGLDSPVRSCVTGGLLAESARLPFSGPRTKDRVLLVPQCNGEGTTRKAPTRREETGACAWCTAYGAERYARG